MLYKSGKRADSSLQEAWVKHQGALEKYEAREVRIFQKFKGGVMK